MEEKSTRNVREDESTPMESVRANIRFLFSFYRRSLSNCGPSRSACLVVDGSVVVLSGRDRKNGRRSEEEERRTASLFSLSLSLSLSRAAARRKRKKAILNLIFSLSFEHQIHSKTHALPLFSLFVAVCTGCPCRLGGNEIGQSPGLAPVRPDDPYDRVYWLRFQIGRKFLQSGKQHTYVETENVRYVYQPLENGTMYLLLVTNKASNILEDLDVLRMLAKTLPEYCYQQVDEEGVSKAAFELIFAFDEVISAGHKENVTMNQIRTFMEMESHEEKLHKMIINRRLTIQGRDEKEGDGD